MTILENVPLAGYTTLGVGGSARYFCEAAGEGEVVRAVEFARERGLRLFVLGGGSNVLVSDEGFAGLVVRVGVRDWRPARVEGSSVLMEMGAG